MLRGTPPFCAVLLALWAAAPGCKSDAADPGAAFIGQYCDIYQPCCTAAGLPADGKACRALFASASSPNAKYDDTAGKACLAGLQQQSAQPGFCTGDIVPPSACAEAFGGATGGCIQDSDCPPSSQGDVRCVSGFVNNTQVRKCQTQTRGAAGSTPCVGSVRAGVTLYAGTSSGDIPDQASLCNSDDGLRCDGTACVALTADGGQCALYTDCVVADFCDPGTGTCAPRKAAGAGCIGAALECQDGSYCDDATMVCAAQLATGAACTDNVQCQTGNCANGACAATPSGGANVLCGGT